MPTLVLSHDDCQTIQAWLQSVDLTKAEAVLTRRSTASNEQLVGAFQRLSIALRGAETIGQFDPVYALELLNKLERGHFVERSGNEDLTYAEKFLRAQMVNEEARSLGGVHIGGLTEKGSALRDLLASWGSPIQTR